MNIYIYIITDNKVVCLSFTLVQVRVCRRAPARASLNNHLGLRWRGKNLPKCDPTNFFLDSQC